MIAKTINIKALALIVLTFFTVSGFSQDSIISTQDQPKIKNTKFYEYRGNNVVDIAVGTSVINGDYPDAMFEIMTHIGYKRYLFPHLNINFSYNKFNLAYKDLYNEGFMSFDLNLECTVLPHQRFSPFIFAGGGYNASNYFKETEMKAQAGAGIEYIVTEGFGIKLYSDYNYMFSDELDGLVFGESDDVYWRVGLGVNFYFGGKKRKTKLLKGQKTVINSNPIIHKQNNTKK